MKRDWRKVLRGVTLRELDENPARYSKEPYRTALREAQVAWDAISDAFAAALSVASTKFDNPLDGLPTDYQEAVGRWPKEAKEALTPGAAVEMIESLRRIPRSRGGKNAGKQAKDAANQRHKRTIDAARASIQQGTTQAEVVKVAAERMGLTCRQARNVLQAASVIPKKKRK